MKSANFPEGTPVLAQVNTNITEKLNSIMTTLKSSKFANPMIFAALKLTSKASRLTSAAKVDDLVTLLQSLITEIEASIIKLNSDEQSLEIASDAVITSLNIAEDLLRQQIYEIEIEISGCNSEIAA